MSASATPRFAKHHCVLLTTTARQPHPLPPIIIKDRQGVMEGDQQQQQDEWARSRHARLPTFAEVLSRKTRPPVDLFMF